MDANFSDDDGGGGGIQGMGWWLAVCLLAHPIIEIRHLIPDVKNGPAVE